MNTTGDPASKISTRERLWNQSFFILWQGQLVSAFGDVIYAIALGFWILAQTGSTALMGALLAAASLPRVLVSPFAGVLIDRSDRKRLLILTDTIRGIAVALVGVAALLGFARTWMLFAAAIVIGLGGAFFNPAVASALPDMVRRDRLVQANSLFHMIYTLSGLAGNSVGGFLFKILGAPVMFFINGLSYLFSALVIPFIRIPRVEARVERSPFLSDLKEGFAFIWRFIGLRHLLAFAAIMNFFASMGVMLILPLFEHQRHLGPVLYGLVMACFTGGLLAGLLFSSIVRIRPASRFRLFAACGLISSLSMILFPLSLHFPLMALLAFAGGAASALLNMFMTSVIQLTVTQEMRGKVFGILGGISTGLMPLALVTGGVLAEFIPIRILISASFAFTILLYLPLFASAAFRRTITFDPDTQAAADLIAFGAKT
ncbi:MAG TPA: MFS transporter [Candidatus Aminicenantes bacterium]|nr:MFS transporter [Candidatus Aminicenantes bacterium]